MHTFKVVNSQSGWRVQLGSAVVAPCKSQSAALAEAERMAASLRRHGESVSVVIDVANANDAEAPANAQAAAARLRRPPKRILRMR